MGKPHPLFERMLDARLVALLSPRSVEDCVTAYEITESEGVVLEIALRSPAALDGLNAIRSRHPQAQVLVGTVMTREQAQLAINAGAGGLVSADYLPAVVEECVRQDVLCIPGGLADAGKQLAQKAGLYGCSLPELRERYPHQWTYKLFPAFAGGHSHVNLVKAWRGPYPDLVVLYTGGISLSTLGQAAAVDPKGVFCASALTKNLDQPEQMRRDIREWKRVLAPESEPPDRETSRPDPAHDALPRVVTFGELMLRLSSPPGFRLKNSRSWDVHFGGAEANVAASLAGFGLPSVFVTALPSHDLGDNALAHLRAGGIDTSFVLRTGNRLGIYFLEHGSGVRPSKVIYDRARSAIALADPAEFDWGTILEGASWFHWTGITPALGDGPAAALQAALVSAKELGLTVSVDLNFRKKLWDEARAGQVMRSLMPYVDVCIGNEEDPTRVFGLQPAGTDVGGGRLDTEGYRSLTQSLHDEFGFKKVAVTLRESVSASENRWSACLFNGTDFFLSREYGVPIIDRVGTGDAFAAGLIFSLLQEKSDADALAFGVAAAVWKHSLWGDFNLASVSEIERLAGGDVSGRIRR
jgi:2-dehydro-3-deoxygluconokinase